MSHIRIILFFVLACNASLLIAQDDDIFKENYELKKDVTKKDNQIKKLEETIAKLSAQNAEVDSLLKAERSFGKSKEVKSQIKELNDIISSLQIQHDNDSIEISNLRKELADLNGFKREWIVQMVSSINEEWLIKTYTQIDIKELSKTLKKYEEFSTKDERIAEACEKLKQLYEDTQTYYQGVAVINTKYEATAVNNVYDSVKALRDKAKDAKQESELDDLLWELEYYGGSVKVFQDVIKAIDSIIENQTLHDVAWPLINAKLKQMEEDVSAIKDIPWLSDQFDKYHELLKKDCLAPNEIRDLIMSIQP